MVIGWPRAGATSGCRHRTGVPGRHRNRTGVPGWRKHRESVTDCALRRCHKLAQGGTDMDHMFLASAGTSHMPLTAAGPRQLVLIKEV